MKKIMMLFVAAMLTLNFATISFAGATHKIMGEVVKVEGEMVEVKDEKGTAHKLHVDKKMTKQTGEIKAGAKVEAEADDKGHAISITAK